MTLPDYEKHKHLIQGCDKIMDEGRVRIEDVNPLWTEGFPDKLTDNYPVKEVRPDNLPQQVWDEYAEHGDEILHGYFVYHTPKPIHDTVEEVREHFDIPADEPVQVKGAEGFQHPDANYSIGGLGWRRERNYSPLIDELVEGDTELRGYLQSLPEYEGRNVTPTDLWPEWEAYTQYDREMVDRLKEAFPGDVPEFKEELVKLRSIPNSRFPGTDRDVLALAVEEGEDTGLQVAVYTEGIRLPTAVGGSQTYDHLTTLAEIETAPA